MTGELCPCGGALRWDPDMVGMTCGNLQLVGWNVCADCGSAFLVKGRSQPTEGEWKLAKGGRSIDTGGGARLRAEGRGGDVEALMVRIQRLPALERALRELVVLAEQTVAKGDPWPDALTEAAALVGYELDAGGGA